MKVLMITGDRRFGPGHPRYELQKSAVERLDTVAWPGVPLLRIFSMARRGRYDVITAQDPFWRAHLAHHLVQLFGGRLNVQVHADLSVQPWHRRLMARFHLRRADTVRVVSEKIKRQVESMGVRARVSVLPVYVDVSAFKNLPREPERIVLWAGRFEREKDPMLALDVIREVPRARLLMLGAGSLEPALRARVVRLNLTNVEFAGWRDVKEYLPHAGVMLNTSPAESFGVAMVEALAAGVPVVAPDVGIAKEAGARVVPRRELSKAVSETLRSGARGELKLTILNKEEWAKAWRASLV